MTLHEILSRLEGVKGHGGNYMARCPAHGDKHQSLSVSVGKDGRVLLHCHTGCKPEDIVWSMGLQMKDLFTEGRGELPRYEPPGKAQFEREHIYPGGQLKKVIMRKPDGGKYGCWFHMEGGKWVKGRNGITPPLYAVAPLDGVVFVAEGEKDVNTLHSLGLSAASGADGAGPGKWRKEHTEQLRGLHVCVLGDNDKVGKDFAVETCNALHGVAASVRLLDLSKVWPEIPEHGDITDMVVALGADRASELIGQLSAEAAEWAPMEAEEDPLLSLFKPLEEFTEEEAEWLVPGWIPSGQISLMAADGGVGKTTLWCHIIAALSNGTTCVLDPPGHTRKPMKITFMTTEDSVRKKLRKKLRLAGANMANIITPDFVADKSGLLRNIKFGSPEMRKVLYHLRPVFCVFDPVQGFLPPKVNMGSRNEMRDCMAPMISIGEEINTTSMVICHTNKRKGASGRDRIADSADLWDIARSVMMAGFTEEQGVRYLSNEKNNYAPLQETVLFTIDQDGQIHKEGTTWKRDREFIQDTDSAKSAPKREDCKAYIIQELNEAGGAMPTNDLDDKAKQAGYSFSSIKRAKQDLKKENAIQYFQTGSAKGKDKVWHIQLLNIDHDLKELPDDTPVPFEEASRQTL